jgi:hypothetical protein
MISTIIAFVLYPVLVIKTFFNRYKEGEFEKEFFNIRQTTVVKGVMIMIVFFYHFSQIVDYADMIERTFRGGQICLTYFFFLAGYTTCLGHLKVPRIDLRKVWIKRAWRLYLPILILSVAFNNFLDALLVFFVITDIAFLIFSENKKRLLMISVGTIIYVLFLIVLGFESYWYNDILTYALGVAMAMHKDDIILFFKRKSIYFAAVVFSGVASAIFVHLGTDSQWWGYYSIGYSFFECILLVLIMMTLNPKSKIFYILGKYSWELFLFHQGYIILFNKLIRSNSLVMICSLTFALVTGVLLNKAVQMLKSRIEAR